MTNEVDPVIDEEAISQRATVVTLPEISELEKPFFSIASEQFNPDLLKKT